MALSQKHEGKCLVPWFCSGEWHFVYNKIFGPNNNEKSKKEALDIIHIWKTRTPLLFRGVEGTYIILEAVLLDRTAYENYNLQLLLSTSIMRFLNICAAYNKNQGTFFATAHKMKIPDWLINLRHDIAHGQTLPSLDILNRALKFSLEWLHQEYWKSTSADIKDFIDETQFECDKTETLKYSLQPFVSNYCYITLVTHSNWNFSTIQDISDKETRNVFLEEIKSMTDTEYIRETTKLRQVLNFLWTKIVEILKDNRELEKRYHVLADLIMEEVFLGNFDEREAIFNDGDKVPKDFIFLWEIMLNKFDTEMLGALIEQLLHILTVDNTCHESKIVASTWILEIAKGLDRCEFIKSIIHEFEKTASKPKKDILKLIIKQKTNFRYNKERILKLNEYIEIPRVINDCSKFKTCVLHKPTEYTKTFISQLIDLNATFKLPNSRNKILELVNLYISNDNEDEETIVSSEIHNVEDLDSSAMEVDAQPTEEELEELNNSVFNSVPTNENVNGSKIWRRVTEINFEKCPIGILPWQSPSMNPLIV